MLVRSFFLVRQTPGVIARGRHSNKRDMEDLHAGRHITVTQYRQRVGQLLASYTVPMEGQEYSFLQRLVRGMPRRLAKCRANRFGPCGK